MTDRGLLDRYTLDGSQSAFAEIAQRHMGMVYAVCRRDLGDAHLAEDATQAVFILLAQKSKSLARDVSIPGWLFAAARFVSRNAARREATRKRHEQEAIPGMEWGQQQTDEAWQGIEPWLNDALSNLNPTDREAILLRYFDGLSVRELAVELGTNEETAGKRVTRAIERMRRFLRSKAAPVSSVLLATLLTAHAKATVPAKLAAAVAAAPSMPLPSIAEGAHSLGSIGGKGIATMHTVKLTAATVFGVALIATFSTAIVRHHLHAASAAPAATTAGPAAPTGALLRLKFTAGQVQKFHMIQNQTGSFVVGTTTIPHREVIDFAMQRDIESVAPDGTATGTMRTTSITMTVNGQPTPPPASMFGDYQKPQPITISPTGEVKSILVAGQKPGGGMWGAMDCSSTLPDPPVRSGATWEAAENLPALGIQMNVPCTLTGIVNRNGHKLYRITKSYSAVMTGKSTIAPITGRMTGSGTELFDNEIGCSREVTSDFDIDGTMPFPPGSAQPQPAHVTMTIQMQIVPDPAP